MGSASVTCENFAAILSKVARLTKKALTQISVLMMIPRLKFSSDHVD